MRYTCRFLGRFFYGHFARKNFFLWGFIFSAVLGLAAQEGAKVYHLEGADFAVTLRGERTVFPREALTEDGISLERSAIVHTGAGSFLELQLLPSGTLVKLSENSSLVYNGLDETGNFTDLGLLYGRIRVVSGTASPGSAVVIRSGGISTRMEQGDIGADYYLDPANLASGLRPLCQVYLFRGGAEVFPFTNGGTQVNRGRAVTLAEGEYLSLDISSSYTYAEKKPLDKNMADYWRLHAFAGVSPLEMPVTAIAAASPSQAARQEAPVSEEGKAPDAEAAAAETPAASSGPLNLKDGLPRVTVNRGKNLALGIGLFLTASSIAVQGFYFSRGETSRDNNSWNYFAGAYATLGMGLITTLVGAAAPSSLPAK